ncbi:intraflagellar transport protein 20 homolog [Daphnia carinata]|uniref:intraflagellar transport protein 20 homolog n=1 Tax=Daphnia carinata TaxID=120202 RepID=UPI00257B7DEE|nr:intraflagellar transport protein 20 homolog [Daphnia carinata]
MLCNVFLKIPLEVMPHSVAIATVCLKQTRFNHCQCNKSSVMDGNSGSAEDELARQGLFIDDIHRLRILDPSVADQTQKLKRECDHFLETTRNFEKTVDAFKKEARRTAAAVEIEKKRAIGYRLLLDALRKKKEQDQRQLMVEVDRRRLKLEQLRVETDMLQKADHFHQEIIDQFQMLH